MSEISFDLSNSTYIELASELYVLLPSSDAASRACAIIPKNWVKENIIFFPSERTLIYLRFEFFKCGKWRLKKEDEITASELIKQLTTKEN